MRELNLSADELVEKLLGLPGEFNLCLLDSCGVSHLNSHLLIAGIAPIERIEIYENDVEKTFDLLDKMLTQPNISTFLTMSYDFGLKINRIKTRHNNPTEPDIFLAVFDVLIIHDYNTKKTYLTGNETNFGAVEEKLSANYRKFPEISRYSEISSNFTRQSYISAVEQIQEFIRSGNTYQTNLTRQIHAQLPENLTPEIIFLNFRKSHPAPFASFIRRKNDIVISASPERFFKVENDLISTSPIKGTRPRGKNEAEDLQLKSELLNSEKDLAENVMIVDLLRNDLGRICEFGSVGVEKLFDLEEHPTLFHLVSTVSGKLRSEIKFSDIIRAVFPCGSITGAPKIRTMKIIDEIENVSRGLSMGAIGFASSLEFEVPDLKSKPTQNLRLTTYDFNVAIRTMTVRGREAIFNVGGGIVIDSIPENEYLETLTKAKALLKAIHAKEIK